jgi:hypothetical protein
MYFELHPSGVGGRVRLSPNAGGKFVVCDDLRKHGDASLMFVPFALGLWHGAHQAELNFPLPVGLGGGSDGRTNGRDSADKDGDHRVG